MSIKTNKILIISGPSGVGKSTVCKHLLKKFGNTLSFSVSDTTRPIRGKEKNGIEYYFHTKDEFESMITSKEILEYDIVHTYYYSTTNKELDRIWSENKIPIMDINVNGSIRFREHFDIYSIFIAPPSLEILEQRIRNRGENDEESLKIRLSGAEQEINHSHNCELVVVNDDLDKTLEEITLSVSKYLKVI